MSYKTYTTDALVCGTYARNTADHSYLLFTREAGMLYADARSAREERSRQRYALQDFSLIRVSLIRGRNSWKIGSVEEQKNYYHRAENRLARGSVVNLIRLIKRFVRGEEANQELYDLVCAGLDTLVNKIEHRRFTEELIQLRVLSLLGYVDTSQLPVEIISSQPAEFYKHHDSQLAVKISQLYEHAINMSHL
jgi:recombinational DNA repair protein (RecF pathway)